MSYDSSEAVVVESGHNPDASIIWLHGLGADGYDFVPVVKEMDGRLDFRARFIFPHAPVIPVTVNGGYQMRAWFDIVHPDLVTDEDISGIRASVQIIEKFIRAECESGIAASRIVLAGFSQGGLIALHAGLGYPERLAGVMSLSGWLSGEHSLEGDISTANRGLPLFMGHGLNDPLVPLALGEQTRDMLVKASYDVEWHAYPMEHSVNALEIVDIGHWLNRVL